MENHHAIKIGKPSISMGHLYHGELLVNGKDYPIYYGKIKNVMFETTNQ